jgi:hypothetical protein
MKINPQKVHIHRSYTIKELSELLGIDKKTCLRWIERGLRVIDGSKNPILINGNDLKQFLVNRKVEKKITLNRNQFLCLTCKVARFAKRGSIMQMKDRKIAQCRVCNGKMSRTIKPHQKDYMISPTPT